MRHQNCRKRSSCEQEDKLATLSSEPRLRARQPRVTLCGLAVYVYVRCTIVSFAFMIKIQR